MRSESVCGKSPARIVVKTSSKPARIGVKKRAEAARFLG